MKTVIERQKLMLQWKMPISILGILINLVMLSSSFAEAANDTKLHFLGNKNIAPVVYLDNTRPEGVAVDIVRLLAQHIPKPVEIKAMDWVEAQSLVARGEADALIQINETEERKKIYDFSDSLLESQFSIFTTTNRVGISGISTLQGLQVGVESGGLPQQLLEKNPQIRLRIIPDFLEGFKLLNNGTIDAVVVDYRVGSYIIAENKLHNIKVSGEPIAYSYSSIAVKKGNFKLLAEINNALRIIKADGSYQKVINNWKPKEVVFQTREQLSHRVFYVAMLSLFILFLITASWMLTLKKELARRKAAEEQLREQFSTLHGIINSVNALIFSVDRQYRYTSFNKGHADAMKSLYGTRIELGRSLMDYMTVPGDRETARCNLDRALAGEQVVEESYSGKGLRSRQYFQVAHSPIKTESGEVIGVAVHAQDLTERKRAEESLSLLAAIVAHSEDAIIGKSLEGIIVSWNKGAEHLYGYREDEIMGCSVSALIPDDRAGELAYILDHVSQGIPIEHFETVRMRKDGCRVEVSVTISPIYDAEGKIVGASTIGRDITERKSIETALQKLNVELEQRVAERTADLDKRSAELSESQQALMNIVEDLNESTAELEQANARLKEVDRLKSMFIASMSHELRTPLNSIIGFSSILHDEWIGPVNAEQKENLAIILRCGKHLLSLINDVIDVSKIEAGRIEVVPQEFDLYDLIQEGITFVAKDIQEKGVDLRLENIHLQIFTDRQRLLQCVLNLLSNAMKFTEKGSISIEAKLVKSPGKGIEKSAVEISVTDTGIGIRAEDLPRMFQPFVRLISPLQATVPGTGLGLYLTRKLAAEVLNGDILLSSEYGKGSRFTIRIPVRTT